MSRRSKSRAKSVRASHRARDGSSATAPQLDWSRLLLLTIIDTVLLILVVAAGLAMRFQPHFAEVINKRTPSWLYDFVAGVLVGGSSFSLALIVLRLNRHFFENAVYAQRLLRASIVVDTVRVGLFAVLFMYGAGIVDAVAHALPNIATLISARASYGIATIFGWLMSGIIGNAAYDLFCRIFLPRGRSSRRNGA